MLCDPARREEWNALYSRAESALGYQQIMGGVGGGDVYVVDLSGADLRSSDLRGFQLTKANLSDASLGMANLSAGDLRGANLRGANLSGANLGRADLSEAITEDPLGSDIRQRTDLTGADLRNAKVVRANLRAANLNRCDLRRTNFTWADLTDCTLQGADLRRALLTGTTFTAADLQEARLDQDTYLHATFLLDIDLGSFCRSDVKHHGPSTVDFRSILKSLPEPGLKTFLRKTGLPDVFVEYMVDCAQSLEPRMVVSLLRSSFISYGGPDEAFARKLNSALQARGVPTFLFGDDAPPGEKLHRLMRTMVNAHDRVILICSKSSLERPGLLNELEETLAREARDGGATYLLPIRLDDYVIDGWTPLRQDLGQAVRDRVIADFRRHEEPDAFAAEMAKLIRVLKK